MDKFQLIVLKKMIHNKEPLDTSQIDTFAKYLIEEWGKNNCNSTPSKLMVKFYKSLPPAHSSDSFELERLRQYMRWFNG